MIRVSIPTLKELDQSAAVLSRAIAGYSLIAISGEMGAGKTTLIQAICRHLGVDDIVSSPTFALINEYFTREGASIFHFDLYRIDKITEMYDFGYEDYFYSGSKCFIEWPEKALELMPEETLFLHIDVLGDGSRLVTSQPTPPQPSTV